MPEIYMQIEWPNKQLDRIYSPSSVIRDYFKPGDIVPLAQFEQLAIEALNKASGRVMAKYGYECTSAMSEIERIRSIADTMKDTSETVKIYSL